MNPIICIAGPTASGKTALAVELALALDGEVVSFDCSKGMLNNTTALFINLRMC